MYALTLLTPPGGEPLSLQEAKLHLKVDVPDDDSYIADLIVAARMHMEAELGRAIVSSTWRMDFDRFPAPFCAIGDWRGRAYGWGYGHGWSQAQGHRPDFATIRIPRSPLQAVNSVKYLDVSGAEQTVDPSTYVVKLSDPGVIAPAFAKYWPPARFQIAVIQVEFVAGYGPVTSVAAAIPSGLQTVTPLSMQGIYVGTMLGIDPGTTFERVAVTAVTDTTFAATFALSHNAGCVINCTPATLRTAMRLLLGHWYANREAASMGSVQEVPLAYKTIMGANWNGEYS